MKFFHRIRQLGCVTVALIMTAVNCPAEADIQVEDRGLDLTEEISIHYPAVTIAEDAELEARINDQIQADNGIKEYLARAAQLISGGSLKTEWAGGIVGEDLLICTVSAEGALETTRPTHVRTGSNIDLRDGHEITAGELFTDETAARNMIESYLEDEVAPDLSAHLQNSEITPMPETFVIEPAGLRLLYPINQLSTLSDRAGDIRIGWYRLREMLDLSEGSILSRLGAEEMIELSPESAEKLRNVTAEGSLPGIPAALGDRMQELTDRYHLLTDPDGYEGGRMFAPEGGAFRKVYLLTDDLSRDWKNSTVQGIRMDEGCAYGLCVGETKRDEWRAALGEPDSEAEIAEDKAEANRIVPGTCDYYSCGNNRLQLYSDEDGTLVSIILTE
ncbi:MAG: hypothetical protein IKE81_01715 [Clostridia bacterium]|nr:hypothetical protein [Clostridia bacterium]